MNRRATIHVAVLLAVSGLTLAAPALVKAASGGTSPSGGVGVGGLGQGGVGGSGQGGVGGSGQGGVGGSGQGGVRGSGQSGAKPQVQPGNVTVTASGGGITVVTRASAILRRPQRFSGNVGAGASGDTIEIERRGRETHWAWAPTTHGIASADGSFLAVWPTNHIGRFAIRALVERSQSAGAASASPTLTITVYRPSLATIYGPGFYGQRTACGERLRRGTLGVASRSLKCGTPVAIYYGGRTIVVPVIDRGPYAHNADWDVTEATARALGIEGTVTIGAVSLPRARTG